MSIYQLPLYAGEVLLRPGIHLPTSWPRLRLMDDAKKLITKSDVLTNCLKTYLGDLDTSTYDLLQILNKTISLLGSYEYHQRIRHSLIKFIYCPKNKLIKVWVNQVVALTLNKQQEVEFTHAYLNLSPQQFQRLALEVLRLKGYTKTSYLNKSMTQSWLSDPCIPAKFVQLKSSVKRYSLLQQVYSGLKVRFNKKDGIVTSSLNLNKSQEDTVNAIADLIKTYCWLNKIESSVVNFTLTTPVPDIVIDCSFQVPDRQEELLSLIKNQGYNLNKPLIGLRVELDKVFSKSYRQEKLEDIWGDKCLSSIFTTKELLQLVGLLRSVIAQHKPTPLSESSLCVAVVYEHTDDVIAEAEYTAKAIHYGLLQPS